MRMSNRAQSCAALRQKPGGKFGPAADKTIVWINGPFGVGKTTVAVQLAARLPASIILNPETIGAVLLGLHPRRPRDFQDVRLWRTLTSLALRLLMKSGCRTVIVPMTVLNPVYLSDILDPLSRGPVALLHFVLDVADEVLRQRIGFDASDPRASKWRTAAIARYFAVRLSMAKVGHVIDMTDLQPQEIAERIDQSLKSGDVTPYQSLQS